ncbi:MAG: DUF370 domain-containing protein [Anaerolineales bacterium]|nr:DUF370 domain-containing protein [Anaerolineales bacterium]
MNNRGLIDLGPVGVVSAARVVTVARADTAGMRRLLGATPSDHILDLTGGQKRQAILVLDSGHVVLAAKSVQELSRQLRSGQPT